MQCIFPEYTAPLPAGRSSGRGVLRFVRCKAGPALAASGRVWIAAAIAVGVGMAISGCVSLEGPGDSVAGDSKDQPPPALPAGVAISEAAVLAEALFPSPPAVRVWDAVDAESPSITVRATAGVLNRDEIAAAGGTDEDPARWVVRVAAGGGADGETAGTGVEPQAALLRAFEMRRGVDGAVLLSGMIAPPPRRSGDELVLYTFDPPIPVTPGTHGSRVRVEGDSRSGEVSAAFTLSGLDAGLTASVSLEIRYSPARLTRVRTVTFGVAQDAIRPLALEESLAVRVFGFTARQDEASYVAR